jgi:hypothetical protein
VDFIEVILEPGDLYFNPAFCWHYVENLSTSISVAFRSTPLRAIYKTPFLSMIILLAENPSLLTTIFGNPRGKLESKRHP